MWAEFIAELKAKYPIATKPPLSEEIVSQTLCELRAVNADLQSLYCITNGLRFESFRVLPIEDKNDPKHTWDGLMRASRLEDNRYLGGSKELLERFLVFADIGQRKAGAMDRTDGTIWYEEWQELRQTDLSLKKFIELCVKEVAEL